MFTLAHLSDPHLTPVPPAPWMAFANKRITGYVNWWLRRQRLHDMRVLDAILADIAACGPDHVAMTGDLCHVGLAEEFDAAQGFMARLGTPERVSFVPGNHDAYVAGALEDCLARFSGFATSDDQAAGFPFLRVRGPLALIGLSSAVPTLPFFATGALGQPQIDRAEALLDYARARELIRVILVHHAPHAGGAKPLRQLTDAAAFEAMLARTGADLVLHGHNHRTSLAFRKGPVRPVPILGVASASGADDGRHEPAAWHLIRFSPGAPKPVCVERRRFTETGLAVTPVALDAEFRGEPPEAA